MSRDATALLTTKYTTLCKNYFLPDKTGCVDCVGWPNWLYIRPPLHQTVRLRLIIRDWPMPGSILRNRSTEKDAARSK